MERDELSIPAEIRECLDELRAEVQALESTAVIDERMIVELRKIVGEIEACLGAATARENQVSP